MRLASSNRPELANRLSARGRPGRGAGFATAIEASPKAASDSSALVRTKRFHTDERMITPQVQIRDEAGGAGRKPDTARNPLRISIQIPAAPGEPARRTATTRRTNCS